MKTWADLQRLYDNQVPESEVLDYKRDCYGDSKEARRELLKDVSSFANSRGGHLLIGIDEEKGVPTELCGIDDGIDVDSEISRIMNIVKDGLDPAFTNLQVHRIQADSGKLFLSVEISRSSVAPHRIASGNYHRFFVRDTNGKHEATMTEMREMFTYGQLVRTRFRDFCRERLDILNDPDRDTTGINTSAGLLVVHIGPLALLTSNEEIDLRALHDSQFQNLQAIGTMGINRRYNFDGLIVYTGSDQLTSYTQVFRNGVIEAAYGHLYRYLDEKKGNVIPGLAIEHEFFESVPKYFKAYAEIGVPPPYVVQITLDGVKQVVYAYANESYREIRRIKLDRNRMFLAECMVDSIDNEVDIHRSIKPAFDSLYNALSCAECPHFNEQGSWVGDSE